MSHQQPVSDHLESFAISAEAETATKTRVSARDFEFTVDEPENLGGDDSAPTPVEYLSGAWAGCLTVVAYRVADEHDIQIEALQIDIEGDLDPRKFLGIIEDSRPGYQELRVDVQIETDAEDAALSEWFAAVEERCPVGDNLSNETPVETTYTVQ